MPRGGFRQGAGGKPSWNYGKTKVIRVPEALADHLLEIARALDLGVPLAAVTGSYSDSVTESKVIDLTGISIRAFGNGPSVYLADLLAAGYEIRPQKLVQSLKIKESRGKQDRAESLKRDVDVALEQLKLIEDKKRDL